MVHETVVHRWDVQVALGGDIDLMDLPVAIDGIDEYLDVFTAAARSVTNAPSGPAFGFACTDDDAAWSIEFPEAGRRVATPGLSRPDLVLRGTAQDLLLFVWGRLPTEKAGALAGVPDVSVLWSTLVPPI